MGGTTRLYDDEWNPGWNAPVAGMALLVPFFLLSWWIEAPIAAWVLDPIPELIVDHAVRDANLATYALLALLIGGLLAVATVQIAREANEERATHETAPVLDTNEHARRGMARLKAAEDRIAAQQLRAIESQSPALREGQRRVEEAPRPVAARVGRRIGSRNVQRPESTHTLGNAVPPTLVAIRARTRKGHACRPRRLRCA